MTMLHVRLSRPTALLTSRLQTGFGAAVSCTNSLPAPPCCRFASSRAGGRPPTRGFRPRRHPNENYRPITVRKAKKKKPIFRQMSVPLGQVHNPRDELEAAFGPLAADVIRTTRREAEIAKTGHEDDVFEQELRMANYLTADIGSVEDLATERRSLAVDIPDEKERKKFVRDMNIAIEKQQRSIMGLDKKPVVPEEEEPDIEDILGIPHEEEQYSETEEPDLQLDRGQLAYGEWSEKLIQVTRTIKLWRGGRLESYRALVIGGNMNGCGGFGVGKAKNPMQAVVTAGRICKRNIFFVSRHQGDGLTRDLVGKQNSCKVYIRATDNGLRGNLLVCSILKRFGITNAVVKTHGNRNVFNVVRATYKALLTHESLEEIALKRGKRIVSIDRAIRMQI